MLIRALMAGEPLWNTPDDGGSGAPSGDEGAGKKPSDGDDSDFDKGYGKGVKKGQRQAMDQLLSDLGVESVDDIKAGLKAASEARKAKEKAAEESGEFKQLYESLKAENETLKARAKKADAYEESQKKQLSAISEKLSDSDRALVESLPLESALPLAQRLAGAAEKPVGGPPAGNGGNPDGGKGKDLAYYEKKGWENLTPEEQVEAERLEAEKYSMTVGELRERHQNANL